MFYECYTANSMVRIYFSNLSHTEPIQHYFLDLNDPLSPTASPLSSRSLPLTRRAASEIRDM